MDRREFVKLSTGAAIGLGLAGPWAAAQDVPRRYLHCYTHRLDMERGFKFHCLVPERVETIHGRHQYAGFFTVRVGEQPWMFVGDTPPEHVRVPAALADLKAGTFSLRRESEGQRLEQFAQWCAAYPATWLAAQVEAAAAGAITGALLGWGWADRAAPLEWLTEGQAPRRGAGQALELPERSQWVGYYDEHGPFTGLLVFGEAPPRAWVDDDGVYWTWGSAAAGQKAITGPVAYLLAPGRLPAEDLGQLTELLRLAPSAWVMGVAEHEGKPVFMAMPESASGAPIPPSLAPLVRAREATVAVPTVAGELLMVPAPGYTLTLPFPERVGTPLPAYDRGRDVGDEVGRLVGEVLKHRTADGRFRFSEGRTFYDGLACGALAQVLPILPEPVRAQTAQAVGTCLDALCDGHQRSGAYGLLVPPEIQSFIDTAIDYPEITATLLYAMLAYTLNADADYARQRADLIELHVNQIREMTTPEGLSWARADTEHLHLIAESGIGGYIAWCSLHHLGKLLGKSWASECRARAALTWFAHHELFRWRAADYGETGVVNGWSNWCAELSRPEPWAYVQSTWFSYMPFMAYAHEDELNLWRNLRDQPWWDYTRTEQSSRQRCYDYANMLALAKAGHADEVRAHWADVHPRPFWYDTFDATPIMAIAALPQLADLDATN